jgi:hypothetical protein
MAPPEIPSSIPPIEQAHRLQQLRRARSRVHDTTLFASPVDFRNMLNGLRPAFWPPSHEQAEEIGTICGNLIHLLHRYEGGTFDIPRGSPVIDAIDGEITTAQARRLLTQEVGMDDDGSIGALLIAEETLSDIGEEGTFFVQLHAFPDRELSTPGRVVLDTPEILVGWTHRGDQDDVIIRQERRGPGWYMLEQLRDDALEGRMAGINRMP